MADGFVPPQTVRSNAKRGLELRDKYNRGGTAVGVARARDLSNGASLPLDTIKRMNSYFARHEVDKQGEGWGTDSAGYIAWLLWGGDAGWSWVKGILKDQEKKDKSMNADFANSYAAIIKQEKQEDGSLLVYGKATDDSLDIDQQICDDTWLASAMPAWFKSGGNIREQHSSIAAGVAKEYEAKSDGHYISVLVVDPISVKKVESGVLKGFSIGIKSPRVVRDQKAANGRIIDGQIVEVSLVDRPANPNAKLMLAKSVEGEANLVQVEELIEIEKADKPDYENINAGGEKSDPADMDLYNKVKAEAKAKFDVYPSAVANAWVVREYKSRGGKYKKATKTKDKSMLAEVIKELHADSAKFDQASYDAARRGIAALIISEASEIGETDSDERDDIDTLLDALKHLFNFRDGELDEDNEAALSTDGNTLNLAADATSKDCDCDGCAACADDGGCDDDICKGCTKMTAKSADISKCLECGCHDVSNAHGKTQITTPGGGLGNTAAANVSTAVIVTPEQNAGSVKSADAEEAIVEEVVAEEVATDAPVEEEKTEDILDEKFATSIIEKATKSVSEMVKAEIDSYKTALKAAEDKSVALESELVLAKSAAASGGPKRTGKVIVNDSNELLIKAAEYRLKASATSDPILAKGYKALESEYLSKAGKSKAE